MVIGISGYTGSGKSVLAEYLCAKFNAEIIDADKIARKIMLENNNLIDEVTKAFDDVDENGAINFVKLGKIVFENSQNLQKLNKITFPYIIPAIKQQINNFTLHTSHFTLIDAPLLPLISPQEICDFAIWVYCPVETRLERLIRRTKLDKEVVKNRITVQMNMMPAPKPNHFWHFVENNAGQNEFFAASVAVLNQF